MVGVSRLAAAVLLLVICGCTAPGQMPSSAPPADGPITSEAAYRAQIVGRDLITGPDEIARHSADGSWLMRRANHIVASGIWDWQGALWCRSGRIEGAAAPRACHALSRTGEVLSMTSPEGEVIQAIIRTPEIR